QDEGGDEADDEQTVSGDVEQVQRRTAVVDPGEHGIGAPVEQGPDDDDFDDEHGEEAAGHRPIGTADTVLQHRPQQDHSDHQLHPVHDPEDQAPDAQPERDRDARGGEFQRRFDERDADDEPEPDGGQDDARARGQARIAG